MNANQELVRRIRSERRDAPCVSIYFNRPRGRLSDQVPSIELYRELSYARGLLETSMPRAAAAEYLKPIWKVAKDELLKEGGGSLALFHSGEVSMCVPISEPVSTRTVVAGSFHVKPLLKEEGFTETIDEGRTVTGLFQVAQALRRGKASRLWVAEDVSLWGVLSRRNGTIVLHPRQMNDRADDVLDDLAEWALDQGVDVHVVPRFQIPGQHPVIAEGT